MKDGYPDRVCDYCHLQLNTFHAFVKKAKTTSDQFAKIIEDAIRVDLMEDAKPDLEPDLEPESISITAMEFDIKPEQSIATNANSLEATLDIIVNNENDDSIETQEIESDSKLYEKFVFRLKIFKKLYIFQMNTTQLNIWMQSI